MFANWESRPARGRPQTWGPPNKECPALLPRAARSEYHGRDSRAEVLLADPGEVRRGLRWRSERFIAKRSDLRELPLENLPGVRTQRFQGGGRRVRFQGRLGFRRALLYQRGGFIH